MDYIVIGVVAKPFGIKGEIKVKPLHPASSFMETADWVWLRRPGADETAEYGVLKARPHKEFFVLVLDGVDDRNAAELLRGMEVIAPENELEELEDDEYYAYQLVGLPVYDTDGEEVGRVDRIEETAPEKGGSDIIVVDAGDVEIMFPAADGPVVEIDLSQEKIVVDRETGVVGKKG